jgi:glycine dehydrogenase
MASVLAGGLRDGGVEVVHDGFFDTVVASVPGRAADVVAAAHDAGIALRLISDDEVGVSCSEVTTVAHLTAVWQAFGVTVADVAALDAGTADALPSSLVRDSGYLTHPTFHEFRSETSLMRWLRRLADADLALDRTMIPLGSCTMKLNAAAEMEPITWPEFADLHPFAPEADTEGSLELIAQLERWLAELTGYAAVSVQPNAGSQGELAGLLAIAAYHRSRGDDRRAVCLIPSSAHGTNAASAVMAGMRVVVVGTDAHGNVDLDDLHAKIDAHRDALAALMITYPSTHGVYETEVRAVCDAVHEAGGQVYVDGANLNALVGLARPGAFGGDVSHLNLHKTFCIPHGGGGPGVGPVAVAEHLVPFLPGRGVVGAVSAAPHGSPGVLPISWAYIRMMGVDGLRRATLTAVAAANYVAKRLGEHYPVLYAGRDGAVAHECILDLRGITKESGVTVDDVAKRLADYGLHAPTMSFPVAGTLMVEPTESEDLAEIDRFVDAMIGIRDEIRRVQAGEWPVDDNPLRGAPHTAACLVDKWDHPYSRDLAAYPTGAVPGVHDRKVWPPVRRIDQAHGDRNLVCSCPPIEAYSD